MTTKLGKLNLIIIIIFALSVVGLKIWQYHWSDINVELKNKTLHVLVAKTPYQHNRGLGGRDSLEEYDGMLFIFTLPRRVGIVMRDMAFPLDIVWLNDSKVVDFASNVPIEPGVAEEDLKIYYPRLEADLVLELPAGWAKTNELKIGDAISLTKKSP